MSQEVHGIHCAHEADLATFRQAIINIEVTLEKMSGILAAQAKLEERTTHIEKTIGDIDNRLRNIESTVSKSSGKSEWSDKILWAMIGGGLSTFITTMIAKFVV